MRAQATAISSSTAATPSTRTTSAAPRRLPTRASIMSTSAPRAALGLERGYCMMIGGDVETVNLLDPIFDALAPGYGSIPAHAGARRRGGRCPGGEGLYSCRSRRCRPFRQDDSQRHRIWPDAGLCRGLRHPQVEEQRQIARRRALRPKPDRHRRSLAARAASSRRGCSISPRSRSPRTACSKAFRASVADSGEGQWTIDAAMEEKVPANVLTASLFARYRRRVDHTFATRCCRRCASASAAMSRCRSEP